MEWVEVLSNLSNLLGFLCLFSSRPFHDLVRFWRKELGTFGMGNHWVGNRGWIDTWEFKYAVPIGMSLIFIGNVGLLIASVVSLWNK